MVLRFPGYQRMTTIALSAFFCWSHDAVSTFAETIATTDMPQPSAKPVVLCKAGPVPTSDDKTSSHFDQCFSPGVNDLAGES